MDLARQHSLYVIEDCVQANGASFGGQPCGSFGDIGCFSLQFNKIITSGEGGMLVTHAFDLWERAAMYHDAGATHRDHAEDQLVWGLTTVCRNSWPPWRLFSSPSWMVCWRRCGCVSRCSNSASKKRCNTKVSVFGH